MTASEAKRANLGGRPRNASLEAIEAALSSTPQAQLSELRVQVEHRHETHVSPFPWDSKAGRGYIRLAEGVVAPADEIQALLHQRKVPLPHRLQPKPKVVALLIRAPLPELRDPEVAKAITLFATELAVALRAQRLAGVGNLPAVETPAPPSSELAPDAPLDGAPISWRPRRWLVQGLIGLAVATLTIIGWIAWGSDREITLVDLLAPPRNSMLFFARRPIEPGGKIPGVASALIELGDLRRTHNRLGDSRYYAVAHSLVEGWPPYVFNVFNELNEEGGVVELEGRTALRITTRHGGIPSGSFNMFAKLSREPATPAPGTAAQVNWTAAGVKIVLSPPDAILIIEQ